MPKFGGLGNVVPFTAQLGNVEYLAKSAMLSRLAVSAVRVVMNRPGNIADPTLTHEQKQQAFWERVFVEVVGTPAYMAVMHLASDATAKILEVMPFLKPKLKIDGLSQKDMNVVNRVLAEVAGTPEGKPALGLLANVVFPKEVKPNWTTFKQKLSTEAPALLKDERVVKAVQGFFRRANIAASVSLLAGVVASAWFGGNIIQKVNDEWVAPWLTKVLNRFKPASTVQPAPTGEQPAQVQTPPQTFAYTEPHVAQFQSHVQRFQPQVFQPHPQSQAFVLPQSQYAQPPQWQAGY